MITEGNYLLLDDPAWAAGTRRRWTASGSSTSEEALRVERLVARHVEFGKSPEPAQAWVAGTDQPNAELVSPTAATADRGDRQRRRRLADFALTARLGVQSREANRTRRNHDTTMSKCPTPEATAPTPTC